MLAGSHPQYPFLSIVMLIIRKKKSERERRRRREKKETFCFEDHK
jgi:hypothetical protein